LNKKVNPSGLAGNEVMVPVLNEGLVLIAGSFVGVTSVLGSVRSPSFLKIA